MSLINEKKRELREILLSKGIDTFIGELKSVLNEESELYEETILLEAFFRELKRKERLQILEVSQLQINENRIRKNSLEIIRQLTPKDIKGFPNLEYDSKNAFKERKLHLSSKKERIPSTFLSKKTILLSSILLILILITYYKVLPSLLKSHEKDGLSKKENNYKIENSNVITGNDNSINIDSRTYNDKSNISIIYHTGGNESPTKNDKNNLVLIPLDEDISVKRYLGTETFYKCDGYPRIKNQTMEINFKLILTNKSEIARLKINWGDGSLPITLSKFGEVENLSHRFPLGNTIMQIETTHNNGDIKVMSYNIFWGMNPALGTSLNTKSNFCKGDTMKFSLHNFALNSPWTLYRLFINDGSDTISFVNPEGRIVNLTHKLRKVSKNIVYPNKKMDKQDGYFIMTMTAENPCFKVSTNLSPILVKDCN